MSLLLYLSVSASVLFLWNRGLQRVSRAAAAVLILLPLVFTGDALLRGRVYAPIDLPYATEPLRDHWTDYGDGAQAYNGTLSDLYMQMIPWQSSVRQAFRHGELPLWNPHMLGGTVLAANMQSAPWDPLNLIGLLIDQADALTFAASMTFFMAGLFTFSFVRTLNCGELASLISAAAYMFSATLAFFVQWPLGRAWVFLPLVFYGTRLVVRETTLRAASVLTGSFVLVILSGHPESVLHIVACGAVWGLFELFQVSPDRRMRAAGQAVLCGFTALLLTAFTLLPFFEAAPQTADYHFRRTLYASHDFAIPAEVILRRLKTSVFPFYEAGRNWNPPAPRWDPTNFRVGSLVLTLAILAMVTVRQRVAWFFAGFALFAGLAGLNAWPVAWLLHELPVFNIALNERLVFAAAFALSILAGLAAEAWPCSRAAAVRASAVVVAIGLGLTAGSALLRHAQLAASTSHSLINTAIAAELIPLALAVILFAVRAPRRVALLSILALVLMQRKMEDGNIYPSLDPRMFYPDIPILGQLRSDPRNPFRIAPLHFALVPNTAAAYGLEDVRGYEAMTFRRLSETYPLWCEPQPVSFNIVADWNRPFLSFLNVRYSLAASSQQPTEQWKLVDQDRQSRLFENTRVLPRAFVPNRVEYIKGLYQGLETMMTTADFGEVAWISAPELEHHSVSNGPGEVNIIHSKRGDLRLDVRMEHPGWVITSEPAWRGWRSYIDGNRIQPHYANHAFLGVHVPAGRHDVRLIYLPESFTRGRNLSAATLVGLLAWLASRTVRARRSLTQPIVDSSNHRP